MGNDEVCMPSVTLIKNAACIIGAYQRSRLRRILRSEGVKINLVWSLPELKAEVRKVGKGDVIDSIIKESIENYRRVSNVGIYN